MSAAHLPFDKRNQRILRKQRRMAHSGIVHSVGHDGLIIARARRRAPRFPLKGLMLVLLAGLAFKSFVYMNLGAITYNTRVETLASGSFVEQAGAWIMQADPVTVWIVQMVAPYV